MRRRIAIGLVGALICTFPAWGDESTRLSTLLQALALNPSDLAIAKDYLPDPDRLEIARNRMRDPVEADRWLKAAAERLMRCEASEALAVVGSWLSRPSEASQMGQLTDSHDGLRRSREILADAIPEASGMMALVHPDSSLNGLDTRRHLSAGRSVEMARLVSVAFGWLTSLEQIEYWRPNRLDTPFGAIAVGSPGDDIYEGPIALVIDPGGNDRYVACAGVGGSAAPVSVVIDLGGNDRYEGAAGVGRFGVGVLVDRSGDDVYTSASSAQGAGIAGIGILVDGAGDDNYTASVGAQGFGLYGIGLLVDEAGNDRYGAASLAQGASGPGGVGVLIDRKGQDSYQAAGPFKDFREEGRYARSMSQGFAFGIQTEASGGVGLLVDGGGNDTYTVEYFGQGGAIWGGLGGLYDGAGHDRFTARRYAQGCGVHLSTGLLVDDSGDDVYSMWAVGQGCGHDLAVGVLSDGRGSDTYDLSWLGQGAASGNGTGLLLDASGDDTYRAEGDDTQGYGSTARNFGSIGLLLDSGGHDQYRHQTERPFVITSPTSARLDREAGSP
ncbi:MAG: hypothetical protein CME19_07825 [Gemmatimonadetes bacterium]|nr:hypothetical protein [Gemmatimonadota bacterium]